VGSARLNSIAGTVQATAYVSSYQFGMGRINVMLRTRLTEAAVTSTIRRLMAAKHPDIPVEPVVPMDTIVDEALLSRRVMAVTLGAFSAIALGLAAIGLYAVLAFYVLLVAVFERGTTAGEGFWASLPFYLTFTTNWFVSHAPGERVIFYFAWSLAVQEQFYLLWPTILRYFKKRYAVLLPLAFVLYSDLARWIGAAWHLEGAWPYKVAAGLDSPIFLGVIAAIVLESERGFRLAHRVAGQAWSVFAAIGLVLLPVWFPGMPQDLLNLSITLLVAACVLAPPWTTLLVSNPVARHIGDVSYGIYLLHMLTLNGVRRLVPGATPAVLFGIGFPLVVLAASASHRWFEQPFMRFREARFPQAGRRSEPELPAAVSEGPVLR